MNTREATDPGAPAWQAGSFNHYTRCLCPLSCCGRILVQITIYLRFKPTRYRKLYENTAAELFCATTDYLINFNGIVFALMM